MKTTGELKQTTQTWDSYDGIIHVSMEEMKELIRETIKGTRRDLQSSDIAPAGRQMAQDDLNNLIENAYSKIGDRGKFTIGITVRMQSERPNHFVLDNYEQFFKVVADG